MNAIALQAYYIYALALYTLTQCILYRLASIYICFFALALLFYIAILI